MNIALYLRVSTDKQETENQAVQLREFAAKQGWQVVHEYCDNGISGKHSDRPQFHKMFEDASRRKFDVLLFWALDRLSREGVLETLQHLNRLTSYGVGWRSFTEQYLDSTGVFRDAVISILATVAKQERVQLSERTKAGLARVKAAGKQLGRPTKFNGEHHAAARRLRAAGVSYRGIAAQLGISLRTAQRLAVS
jgi:DNA invertase Pin-like site-specific DNA recombinase